MIARFKSKIRFSIVKNKENKKQSINKNKKYFDFLLYKYKPLYIIRIIKEKRVKTVVKFKILKISNFILNF